LYFPGNLPLPVSHLFNKKFDPFVPLTYYLKKIWEESRVLYPERKVGPAIVEYAFNPHHTGRRSIAPQQLFLSPSPLVFSLRQACNLENYLIKPHLE
jgi:hypothetical protein